MWKDTRRARQERYENYLKACSLFYQTSKEMQEKTGRNLHGMVCNYVLAPVIGSFILWLLDEAVRSQKKRLYFLSRDGYFMYRTAVLVCKKMNIAIECRYLYCSRYSLRLSAYSLDHQGALDYICRGGIDVTIGRILERTGLPLQEKKEILEEINDYFLKEKHRQYEMNDPVSHVELEKIRTGLDHSSKFWLYLDEHSKFLMPFLEGYLVQEGMLDAVDMAIVDSGWVGSMQKVLNQVLDYIADSRRKKRENVLEGYYWGMYELPKGADASLYHSYYFSQDKGLWEKVYFSNCLFECICSAPHGMTMGYYKQNEKFYPLFGNINKKTKKLMLQTESYLNAYMETFCEKVQGTSISGMANKMKGVLKKILRAFMGQPDREEALLYGNLTFTDDVLEREGRVLAESMTEKELSANHVFRKVAAMLWFHGKTIKESAWYEGSAVNNGKHVNEHLRRYAAYKYLLYLKKQILWKIRWIEKV